MIQVGDDFHNDLRFDEFLMLGSAETKLVVDLLTPVLDANRQRARKGVEEEAFNRTVGLVVANALAGGEQGICYSRRWGTYSGKSPYKPDWLGSKRLLGVIDRLAAEGFLKVAEGQWAGVFSKGARSSFVATPLLNEQLDELGIKPDAVRRDRVNSSVILLKGKGDQLIRYDPKDEQIVQQANDLKEINSFIAAQEILLPGWKGKSSNTDLTRVYVDGSLFRCGRHFGGWLQLVKSVLRPNVLINGERTVELDFGGFNTRALYHLIGKEFQGDDTYDIPEVRHLIETQGLDWDEGRKAVKRMVNIAIGAKSKAALLTDKAVNEISLDKGLIRVSIPLIMEFHKAIKDHLFKGKSLELMKLESDICQDILVKGMKDNVVILPVFDSFLTSKKDEDYLRHQMIENYRKRVGYDPVIH